MEGVDNKQVTSRRDAMLERLKKRYPEKDFSDDESVYGQIYDDYDGYEGDLNGYKEREAGFVGILDKYPNFAYIISQAAQGEDPIAAMIEKIGIDGITDILNDPEKKEKYIQANTTFLERLAKEKELEEQYNKNLEESLALLEQIQQNKGLSDEQMDAAYDLINKIAKEAILGKYTAETVDMALNALNHDADVATAREEGTIAGKNAKIEENLRRKKSGDGMPPMGGSGNTQNRREKVYSIFDAAREAN